MPISRQSNQNAIRIGRHLNLHAARLAAFEALLNYSQARQQPLPDPSELFLYMLTASLDAEWEDLADKTLLDRLVNIEMKRKGYALETVYKDWLCRRLRHRVSSQSTQPAAVADAPRPVKTM